MSGIAAKDAYVQYVEGATDVRPFVAQLEQLLQPSDTSDSESDSEEGDSPSARQRGNCRINGILTTKEERRNDRARAYNLTTVGKDRQWLQDALLTSSESSEDETTQEGKDRRIKQMLREHKVYRKYSSKYQKNPYKYKYMFYSAGLLSNVDRYVPPERYNFPVPSSRGRRGRPPTSRGGERGRGERMRGAYKPRRGRAKEGRNNAGDTPTQDGFVDWDDQLQGMTSVNDSFDCNASTNTPDKPSSTRGRKKLSSLNTPEALTAQRRRHWQLIVKKDLGKVQRARTANHKEAVLQSKRLAAATAKHWRNVANHSQKNMKETVWRCKRLSKEMQAYWKRYDRAERDTRRRMEREAEEQRKMDVELMEAKRQRRKLNFLITQTELYAHFMQRKGNEGDNGAEHILRQLDEDADPRLAAIDQYDSEAMKAQASRNAREAFRTERARAHLFDTLAGAGAADVDVERDVEEPPAGATSRPAGDHPQPDIFQGTLKGYQLKGMNWLANLYDQGISGILADEMGLGKTVQCIAFLCHVAERLGVWGPFLVVSPASTLHNWQQEVERFAPHFKVVPYWGSPGERRILRQFWERKDLHTPRAAFHVVVTSYQIVVSDLKYLNRIPWQHMILDEAQAIKSSTSVRWKQLLGFSCRNRLLLSGTPIQNSMAELWALLHFIMPTLFDSHDEFNEWFSKDIESHAENKTTMDEKHLSRLHMILKPFMLRRIKKDVENELSDKIEIMVHCPLTIRQKLLYMALKKKIRIEDLLHVSIGTETGHNVDKNFTSNLMNLVMQFRKVCNHPELFERRDVRSPFALHVDDYHIPKIIAEECILIRAIPSNRHLVYNKLSILTPDYIHQSLEDVGRESGVSRGESFFAFTRFMDLSPMEVYRVMLCGWLHAMYHIEDCLENYARLRHRQFWWSKNDEKETAYCVKRYERVRSKHMLLVCPDGDVLRQRKEDGLMWRELLFTDPLWINGGPFYTYTDVSVHYMPETLEHRLMRSRHQREAGQEEMLSEIKTEDGEMVQVECGHKPRPARVFPLEAAPLPLLLITAQPKVRCETRAPFAVSRSHAYHETRHRHAESALGSATLERLTCHARPPQGWASVQVPDKNQLVSDAGKLTVLDSLLKKLKESGHRVLIYSQMTKMIDLLEEYMWHRKHKYMRLDGSSKISARRDMVADFQARSDIFVFLLSTRAGGLGINLTAADTVIFYDSDWNPTVDQQAMDRAHRLGQTKQVTVYRLICQGTIEERIMQRAREKSEIQRMVISGGNFKPDTLKPKEVVSLLLDDEEIELKYRQKSEEKKREERERKRKFGTAAQVYGGAAGEELVTDGKRSRDSAEPGSPPVASDVDVDTSTGAALTPTQSPWSPLGTGSLSSVRGGRGGRRGRPRGPRHAASRRVLQPASPAAGGDTSVRARRGPGRPRSRAHAGPRTPVRRDAPPSLPPPQP